MEKMRAHGFARILNGLGQEICRHYPLKWHTLKKYFRPGMVLAGYTVRVARTRPEISCKSCSSGRPIPLTADL